MKTLKQILDEIILRISLLLKVGKKISEPKSGMWNHSPETVKLFNLAELEEMILVST